VTVDGAIANILETDRAGRPSGAAVVTAFREYLLAQWGSVGLKVVTFKDIKNGNT